MIEHIVISKNRYNLYQQAELQNFIYFLQKLFPNAIITTEITYTDEEEIIYHNGALVCNQDLASEFIDVLEELSYYIDHRIL